MGKPEQTGLDYVEDGNAKFNMELADQKLLQSNFHMAATASLVNNPVVRFRSLKNVRVMISQRLGEGEYREQLKKLQDGIYSLVISFEVLIKVYHIYFNEEQGDYVISGRSTDQNFPKEFYSLRFRMDLLMDSWEEEMRNHMITLGLINVKNKGGLDATGG